MTPVISIVVPAYNVERYIDECLDAILAQMEAAHELVVVDDGSSDATAARIAAHVAAHPHQRINVIRQANQGISCARNGGLKAAQGEYIAFVDSDDVLLPGALAALGEAIARHQTDAIVCDFQMWRPDKESKSRRVSMGYPAGQVLTDRSAILSTFFADSQMYVWAHVFRRAVYGRLPDPVFPPGCVYEDVATLPRLLCASASLVYLPQPIVDYRQHPTSITRVISERWCLDFTSALLSARRHLDAIGVDAAVARHFDVAIAHFYIGVVKNSYQLALAPGRRVRAAIADMFRSALYGDIGQLRAQVAAGHTTTHDRGRDLRMLGQVRAALSGSLLFGLRQAASRKFKMWQRMRRTRRAAQAGGSLP